MFDVCHADELCRVRCKVERRFLINGMLVGLHSELLVTEGQMGGAWGLSNKSDTFGNGDTSRKESISIVTLQRVKLDYCKI
jgi:hypothetical protein